MEEEVNGYEQGVMDILWNKRKRDRFTKIFKCIMYLGLIACALELILVFLLNLYYIQLERKAMLFDRNITDEMVNLALACRSKLWYVVIIDVGIFIIGVAGWYIIEKKFYNYLDEIIYMSSTYNWEDAHAKSMLDEVLEQYYGGKKSDI